MQPHEVFRYIEHNSRVFEANRDNRIFLVSLKEFTRLLRSNADISLFYINHPSVVTREHAKELDIKGSKKGRLVNRLVCRLCSTTSSGSFHLSRKYCSNCFILMHKYRLQRHKKNGKMMSWSALRVLAGSNSLDVTSERG